MAAVLSPRHSATSETLAQPQTMPIPHHGSSPEPRKETLTSKPLPLRAELTLHPAFTIDQPLITPDYRASQVDTTSSSPPRHNSVSFPVFHSSLPYALVRDFAYPPYNPLHYGPLEYNPSGFSTPTADMDIARRLSDPSSLPEGTAGPWGDSSYDESAFSQQLPSTSFTYTDQDSEDDSGRSQHRYSRHRKSKSYTDVQDAGHGRQRLSGDGIYRNSKTYPHSHSMGEPYYASSRGSSNRGSSLSRQLVPADRQAYTTSQTDRLQPSMSTDSPSDHRPPFIEDTETVPYSPSSAQHRPESASLDESFAGPSLALYDFSPEHDNELALKEGQIIQVGYRHGLGWLVALDPETGEQGLVPEEYVRLLRDIEGWEGKDEDQEDESVDAEQATQDQQRALIE